MKAVGLRLPVLWVGLSLVIWGWLSSNLFIGLMLALIAEIGNYSPLKWEFDSKHFYRVADLNSLLFAVIAIYQFNEHSIYAIYEILALLPVCLFPLLAAERFTTTGAIPLSALFLSLRKRVLIDPAKEEYVGVAGPYVLVCALAASTGDMPPSLYLPTALVLVIGVLIGQRTRRYRLLTWLSAVCAVAGVALIYQFGISTAQRQLESSFAYWVNQFAWFQTDPNRARTSIGSIGRLKLSDRIRVRLFAPLSIPLPVVLHEASYSDFNLGTWSSKDNQFTVIDPVSNNPIWNLETRPDLSGARNGRIIVTHSRDVEVTPLPYGSQHISGSEVIEVQRSQYGTALVEALPGQFEYRVSWQAEHRSMVAPTDHDLSVPDNYLPTIEKVAQEIGLQDIAPREAIGRVSKFFAEQFKYSLIQKGFYPGRTPLSHFLLKNRQGHCEYFATATTLLLRHAGIPARYAVGYLIDEYSTFEGAFVARARDAHSWVEAYVDGRWIVVDTTPSDWSELEQANASSWQVVQDAWSWISNRYSRFGRTDRGSIGDSLIWFVPPLGVLLIWRLRKQVRKVILSDATDPLVEHKGIDSELYELTTVLQDQGIRLAAGDTLATFLDRNVEAKIGETLLRRIVDLHYRYRFAAQSLSESERSELRDGSNTFCAHYRH
ncbi:MAG: transglutaminase-like putative cysteine protease [Gammaproteobacteria bacterium]|jgi:transglutaminase-like putative cysteine protease